MTILTFFIVLSLRLPVPAMTSFACSSLFLDCVYPDLPMIHSLIQSSAHISEKGLPWLLQVSTSKSQSVPGHHILGPLHLLSQAFSRSQITATFYLFIHSLSVSFSVKEKPEKQGSCPIFLLVFTGSSEKYLFHKWTNAYLQTLYALDFTSRAYPMWIFFSLFFSRICVTYT